MNEAIERANMQGWPQLPTVRDDEVATLRLGVAELLTVLRAAYDDLLLLGAVPSDDDVLAWRDQASRVIARWIR